MKKEMKAMHDELIAAFHDTHSRFRNDPQLVLLDEPFEVDVITCAAL